MYRFLISMAKLINRRKLVGVLIGLVILYCMFIQIDLKLKPEIEIDLNPDIEINVKPEIIELDLNPPEIDPALTSTTSESVIPTPLVEIISQQNVSSLCSSKATNVGPGQKVISFSLYINDQKSGKDVDYVKRRYAFNLHGNLNKTRELYPGWLMRVYTDIDDESGIFNNSLVDEKDFFLCNSTDIPELGNVTAVNGMVWRFLPIGDPTVSIFIVRDLDGILSTRERSAVKQWEESNKTFHGMRDHPWHSVHVLGGMWGAKNYLLANTTRQTFLGKFLKAHKGLKDQDVLGATIYFSNQTSQTDFMIHDSYTCQQFNDSIPFPEKRTDLKYFVGSYYGPERPHNVTAVKCPIECRPKYGQDWTYC